MREPMPIADLTGWLTVEELAAKLKTSVRTIWRMDAKKQLPAPCGVRIQLKKRWKTADIELWIAHNCPDRQTFIKLKGKK